jgi:hypothetical protein
MKRLVLSAAVTVSALTLIAGCDGGNDTTTSPADNSRSTPTNAPDARAGTDTKAAPEATPIGDPGDGDMLAGRGDRADWKNLVTACPNDGQKVIVQKVVTADVTGDGTYDALVARSCEAKTSYWPSTVEVFDGASSSAKPRRVGVLLADVGASDQPWLTSLRVNGSTIAIEAYGVDKNSANACADLTFTYRYRLISGAVKRTARDVGNANKCLPVG